MRFRLGTLLTGPMPYVAISLLVALIIVAVCTYRFFWWSGVLTGYEASSAELNIPWSGSYERHYVPFHDPPLAAADGDGMERVMCRRERPGANCITDAQRDSCSTSLVLPELSLSIS